jgi:hypothetical protein
MTTHKVSLFPLFLILFSCVFISVGLVFFVVQISRSGTILYGCTQLFATDIYDFCDTFEPVKMTL